MHDLPNALVPFLTVVGPGVAALLGGAPIAETVFTWPGIGRFAVQGITARDLPVVQGYALLGITAYVAVSLLVDVIAMAVDPRLAPARVRHRAGRPLWLGTPARHRGGQVGVALALVVVAVAVVGPMLVPYDPDLPDYANQLAPPGSAHWLGTDDAGRDQLARTLAGARTSLLAVLIGSP